jgi:hypothetical protein
VPIHVQKTLGSPPSGYRFLGVWPPELYLAVEGPEETMQKLKQEGIYLSFNLADLSVEELDTLKHDQKSHHEEIRYYVPNSWKKVFVPALSELAFDIQDPAAKNLRLEFLEEKIIPIQSHLQAIATLFSTHNHTAPNLSFVPNGFVEKKKGIDQISMPLFAKGVSELFLDIVKDRLQLVILFTSESAPPLWKVELSHPQELENIYVAKALEIFPEEAASPYQREHMLRKRFRRYVRDLQLVTEDYRRLALQIELDPEGSVIVHPSFRPL